jgi:shikimate 5-dehydrogenase
MSERTRRPSRRHFLISIGAGGAATAAAIVVKSAPSAPQVTADAGKRATRGYQASEHVNNYYRTTKV